MSPLSNPKLCSMNLRPKRRCSREAVSRFQRFAPGTAAPASRGVGGPLAPGRRRPGGTTGRGSAPLTPLLQPLPEPGGPPHEPGRRLPEPPPQQPHTPAWPPLPARRQRPRSPARTPSATPPGRGSPHWRRRRRLRRLLGHGLRPPLPDPRVRSSVPAATAAPRPPRTRMRTHVPRPGRGIQSWGVPGLHDNGRVVGSGA